MTTSNIVNTASIKAKPLSGLDRNEVFERNGKFAQIFVLPIVFSIQADKYQTALDSPVGLDAIHRVIRSLPEFSTHSIEVAPQFLVGSWADVESDQGFSSMALARSADWRWVEDRNEECEHGDVAIGGRRIAVRHIVFRAVGDAPVAWAQIPLTRIIEDRLVSMVKFSTMATSTPNDSNFNLSGMVVRALPIQPFVTGMFQFNEVLSRAVLKHVAHYSSPLAGGDGTLAYEVILDEDGEERIRVDGGRRAGGEYAVSVVIGNSPEESLKEGYGTLEHSRALLLEVARQHGLEVTARDNSFVLN